MGLNSRLPEIRDRNTFSSLTEYAFRNRITKNVKSKPGQILVFYPLKPALTPKGKFGDFSKKNLKIIKPVYKSKLFKGMGVWE